MKHKCIDYQYLFFFVTTKTVTIQTNKQAAINNVYHLKLQIKL